MLNQPVGQPIRGSRTKSVAAADLKAAIPGQERRHAELPSTREEIRTICQSCHTLLSRDAQSNMYVAYLVLLRHSSLCVCVLFQVWRPETSVSAGTTRSTGAWAR